MTFANIKKALSAVDGKIQPAVAIEIHGKFAEGGIRQRQNPVYAAGSQDAKGCRFIVAAQIEALVKDLISCFDGFGAEQLIQPFSRPDGKPRGKFPVEFTKQPLPGIYLTLILLPQAGFLTLKLVHLR